MAMWNHDGLTDAEARSLLGFIREWEPALSPEEAGLVLEETLADYEEAALNSSIELLTQSVEKMRRGSGPDGVAWLLQRLSHLSGVDKAPALEQQRFLGELRAALSGK
jgi:hypothetical protein